MAKRSEPIRRRTPIPMPTIVGHEVPDSGSEGWAVAPGEACANGPAVDVAVGEAWVIGLAVAVAVGVGVGVFVGVGVGVGVLVPVGVGVGVGVRVPVGVGVGVIVRLKLRAVQEPIPQALRSVVHFPPALGQQNCCPPQGSTLPAVLQTLS